VADQSLSQSLWYHSHMLSVVVESLYRTVIENLDLTVIEWHVLQELYAEDAQRPSELARSIARAPTSFTPILDNLMKKGWVYRQPDPADRRTIRIYLTPQAQQFRSKFAESQAELEALVRARVTASEVEQIKHMGQRLETRRKR
jgi:MarR family transcriptional regulator, organic hydroperoxide resistance regulator